MSNPAGENDPLHQLERQAEATRASLVNTVDELRQRASPDALKAGMAQYARDAQHGMLADLRQRAHENPLQVVAVSAGLAYPAWRLLCNLPAPVLLIGAGVALAGRGGASGSKASKANDESAGLAAVDHRVAGAGGIGVSDVSAAAHSPALSTTSAPPVNAKAARASSSNTRTASRERSSWDDLVGEVQRHPLVAGGVGVLIGALFAASLPRSRVENQLFGEASDELKSRASDAVSRA